MGGLHRRARGTHLGYYADTVPKRVKGDLGVHAVHGTRVGVEETTQVRGAPAGTSGSEVNSDCCYGLVYLLVVFEKPN